LVFVRLPREGQVGPEVQTGPLPVRGFQFRLIRNHPIDGSGFQQPNTMKQKSKKDRLIEQMITMIQDLSVRHTDWRANRS
jgi:hypothetical protein